MENMQSFWHLGDELRGHSKASEDHKWLMVASKLAEQTRLKGERVNNLDLSKGPIETRSRDKFGFQEENKFDSLNLSMLNLDSKFTENVSKSSLRNSVYSMNAVYQKNNANLMSNVNSNKYSGNIQHNKDSNNNSGNSNNGESNNSNATDKRFKTLPAAETLPRNEVLGGYIFVCNNDTMQEDLKRQLFGVCLLNGIYSSLLKIINQILRLYWLFQSFLVGLPPRYRDSVRAITPGLPLFLYNYTTHQLHGIFEVSCSKFLTTAYYGVLQTAQYLILGLRNIEVVALV